MYPPTTMSGQHGRYIATYHVMVDDGPTGVDTGLVCRTYNCTSDRYPYSDEESYYNRYDIGDTANCFIPVPGAAEEHWYIPNDIFPLWDTEFNAYNRATSTLMLVRRIFIYAGLFFLVADIVVWICVGCVGPSFSDTFKRRFPRPPPRRPAPAPRSAPKPVPRPTPKPAPRPAPKPDLVMPPPLTEVAIPATATAPGYL
eukprot:gnl/Ergobibamus_cyprinoides/3912.p1 GENE.gnl/Ergobibamus_cyprinoides/3912~~gnl/Ergobibamus_cyprinoides/3912.p1  ORF type:complete len:199 (+),score=31.64 gnl/Ergobibamus_cyprinoides/3912:196-792(+)